MELPDLADIPIFAAEGGYRAAVTVGHKANGKLDRRYRRGATPEDVRRKLRVLLREVGAGRKPQPGRVPTVEQWFTTWLTDIAPYGKRALAPRSLDDYWSRCRCWIFPQMGSIRLDALEPDHLDRLYRAMYSRKVDGKPAPCSEGHVLKTHAVIRRGLEIALRRGKVGRNVAKLLDPPGSPTVAQESLSKAESRRVLEVARGRRNAARWFVGLAIGPRQGETLGLRWDDLDLDEGVISIQWQIQRLKWRHGCKDPHACGGRPRKHNPKGLHRFKSCPKNCARHRPGCPPPCPPDCPGKHKGRPGGLCPQPCLPDCTRHRAHRRGCPPPCAQDCVGHAASCPDRIEGGLVFTRPKGWRRRPRARTVALPPNVVKLLEEHRAAQAQERLLAGNRWLDLDLVFAQVDGAPIDPRVDWAEWKSILAEAGVGDARVHVMRHTTATTLLDMGEDLSVIQEVLGHADSRTTRGYQDVGVEMTRRAAKRMNKALFGTPVADLVAKRRRRRSS
ncbi:tyrosine-type recombinase/integrase [Rhizomonospora bruguierae]|uniref:tyrosine-type recombinase/integrase n=1 Tax=Rhizomonospora bruguierae TaxID=1581705 RepID=UPI001BCA7C77|nr:site-specific integrase [Micromonospora sp. NBRC 107566]